MTDHDDDGEETETSPLLSRGCRGTSPSRASTPSNGSADVHGGMHNGHTHAPPHYRSTDAAEARAGDEGGDRCSASGTAPPPPPVAASSPPFSYRYRRGRDGRAMVAAGFPESAPLSTRAYFPDRHRRGRCGPRAAKDHPPRDDGSRPREDRGGDSNSNGEADGGVGFVAVTCSGGGSPDVVSVCVPCFDEGASSLRRTLDSLRSQRGLVEAEVESRRSWRSPCCQCCCPSSEPRNMRLYRLDVVVIVDGADQMSDSMRRYLSVLFGVYSAPADEEKPAAVDDPFDELDRTVETIVVYPDPDLDLDPEDDGRGDGGSIEGDECDGYDSAADAADADKARRGAAKGPDLNLTLVIKRRNRRKINSHAWWLGAHGRDVGCRYALATDCGTVFHPHAVRRLVDRLEDDADLSAVTGFKRAMTSSVQGDGPWHVEWRRDPLAGMLREVQRYNFEYDQACSAKPAYDTIGFLPVLSGPCFLCRYEDVGDLKRGMLRSYVDLADQPTDDIVLGNLQLAEDRMPPMLLVFGTGEDDGGGGLDDDDRKMVPRPGRKTGLVHDAVYYFENEKPLSQLVKQRRRWSNGTVAAYIWFFREGRWRRRGGDNRQPWTRRLPAAALVAVDLYQAVVGRLFGPGLIAVMTFVVGLFGFDAMMQTELMLDHYEVRARYRDASHLLRAFASGGLYLFLYAAFVGFHTPRAIRKGSRWKLDQESAFHPDLFILALVANAILMLFFWMCPLVTCIRLGWDDTPVPLKGLLMANLSPFIFVLLSGMIHSRHPNVQGVLGLFRSAPIFLLASFWFSVWFPAYATARVSDLTWGNRDVELDDDGNDAIRKRADFGICVSVALVCSNTAVFLVSTFLIYRAPTVAATAAMVLCLAPGFSYAVVIADFVKRVFCRLRSFICKRPSRCCQQ